MTRATLISVLIGIVFSGFEGRADAVGTVASDSHDHGHEVHGLGHTDNHQHDGDNHHDDHFCHCSVHAAALLSVIVAPPDETTFVSVSRYDGRYTSLAGPPLLRPPNS